MTGDGIAEHEKPILLSAKLLLRGEAGRGSLGESTPKPLGKGWRGSGCQTLLNEEVGVAEALFAVGTEAHDIDWTADELLDSLDILAGRTWQFAP